MRWPASPALGPPVHTAYCIRLFRHFQKNETEACYLVVVVVSGIQPIQAQPLHATRQEENCYDWTRDTPRPSYGQKTPKKLVEFNVSFRTVRWSCIVVVSVQRKNLNDITECCIVGIKYSIMGYISIYSNQDFSSLKNSKMTYLSFK